MDAETLAALKASIQHWRDNVEAETPRQASTDAEDCALCEKVDPWADDGCIDGLRGCRACPIYARTGKHYCCGTPYPTAHMCLEGWKYGVSGRNAWRAAAQAELDFLISLLPEGEKP